METFLNIMVSIVILVMMILMITVVILQEVRSRRMDKRMEATDRDFREKLNLDELERIKKMGEKEFKSLKVKEND